MLRSTTIFRELQYRCIKQCNYVTDMLPHHRTWYTLHLFLNNCDFSKDIVTP